MRLTHLALALAGALLLTGPAHATPLNLQLVGHPDIFSAFLDVSYEADTDTLTAHGYALELSTDAIGSSENIVGGTFDLLATILDDGAATGGALSIAGTVLGTGPLLLTGDLIDFGHQDPGGDPLEFLFEVTGGGLAPLYGGLGATFGVILSNTGYSSGFADDFDNSTAGPGTGLSDAAIPVPEPGSGLLVAMGLLAGWCLEGRHGAHC